MLREKNSVLIALPADIDCFTTTIKSRQLNMIIFMIPIIFLLLQIRLPENLGLNLVTMKL